MSDQQERERALEIVIDYVDCQGTPAEPEEEADILRDCVPVPRETLERYEKALRGLYDACMIADADEDLSEHIDGSLLDAARRALEGK